MQKIEFDRRLAIWTVLGAFLLSWPLVIFGRPAYLADSAGYYRGGRVSVEFVEAKIGSVFAHSSTSSEISSNDGATPARRESRGSRSIIYSASAYLLRMPGNSMAMLAVVQIFTLGLIVALIAISFGINSRYRFVLIATFLAVATPPAFFAFYIVPDIFAGLLIGVVTLLAIKRRDLSLSLRFVLVAIGSFAVASHASHPPLAAALVLAGAGLCWVRGDRGRALATSITWLLSIVLLGSIATIASGFIGFGDASLAPRRFPLTLARSIEDGPGRWYLEQNCPKRQFEVCSIFPEGIPKTANDFLFGEKGLQGRATPDQMDIVRAQESEIVIAAAREFPANQLLKLFQNISLQFVTVDLNQLLTDKKIIMDQEGKANFADVDSQHGWILETNEWLSRFTAVFAILYLIWRYREFDRDIRAAIFLIVCGVSANAIICATFSGVAGRYQGRVIWLLPLLALIVLMRRHGKSEPAKK